jgi:hypothetical protein
MKWQQILLGRLILRVCRSGSVKPEVPGCDCGPARRCPLQSYCAAAKLERTTGARLEEWFWVMTGVAVSCGLCALALL